MNSEEKLLALNEEGFLPRESESFEGFILRCEQGKEMRAKENESSRASRHWVEERLWALFRFKPLQIPIFFSNRSLLPWEGAVSWIQDSGEVKIQMREAMRKGAYWNCRTEEILAHEMVHAVRSPLKSDLWEESFAYMTSESLWRRVLGPIVQAPWEVWVFLALSLFSSIGLWFAFFLLSLWVGLGFFRLIKRHWDLRFALRRVTPFLREKSMALPFLVRLTDQEMKEIIKGKDLSVAFRHKKELRWDILKAAYLKDEYIDGFSKKLF